MANPNPETIPPQPSRRHHRGGGGARPTEFVDPGTGFYGWTRTLPERRDLATAAVGDGRLFFGAGFGTYAFYAFDAESGELIWHQRTRDDGPTAATLLDGCVAFNTESCTVCVLDVSSGRTLWERWLGDPLLAQPAAAGGRLFMAWPAGGDHLLGAFELSSGKPLWEHAITADVITAPVVSDDRVYASTFDGRVWCVDAASGKLQWGRDMNATTAPWIWEGEAYVARREDGPIPRARASRRQFSASQFEFCLLQSRRLRQRIDTCRFSGTTGMAGGAAIDRST